jgi:hypothetical protein
MIYTEAQTMGWTFNRAPRWVKAWVFFAMGAIFISLAHSWSLKSGGKPRPEGEWTYPIKFRGEPAIYVPRSVYLFDKLSFPIAIALFLSSVPATYLYRDRGSKNG